MPPPGQNRQLPQKATALTKTASGTSQYRAFLDIAISTPLAAKIVKLQAAKLLETVPKGVISYNERHEPQTLPQRCYGLAVGRPRAPYPAGPPRRLPAQA